MLLGVLSMICPGSKVRYSEQWRKRWPDICDQRGYILRKLGECFEICWDDGSITIDHKNWLEGVE